MRQAINSNPVVQVVLVGVLVLVAGFMLLRALNRGDEASTAESTDTTATATAADADPAAGALEADGSVPAPGEAVAPAPPTGAFEAGPGLPKALVAAHESGDTVVLLITRKPGSDDRRMRSTVDTLRARTDIAVFKTVAKHVADYSRVTRGVNLDRAPALVVLSPPEAAKGELPTASVSYGYRGQDSVEQAIRDAGYRGPRLPFHPG